MLGQGGFRLAAAALALHVVLSANPLYVMGIAYDTPGGNPLIKSHPSTYLVALAALATMRERGGIGRGLAQMFQDSSAYLIGRGLVARRLDTASTSRPSSPSCCPPQPMRC